MSYKVALFDLDGTLTDPKEGICKAVQFSLKKFGIIEEDIDKFEYFIGPPLKDSYEAFLEEEKIGDAILEFRKYYFDKGIYENKMYLGIDIMLDKLKKEGIKLGIATSKPEVMAYKVLDRFDLTQYFDFIRGADLEGKKVHKEYVIQENLDFFSEYDKKDIVMIGDRKFDILGAKEKGLDSIGVTFGYAQEGEFEVYKPGYIVDRVEELTTIILGKNK